MGFKDAIVFLFARFHLNCSMLYRAALCFIQLKKRKVVSLSASEYLSFNQGQTLCKSDRRRYLSLQTLFYIFALCLSTVFSDYF